jgi:hypothetical protein
VTGGGFGRAGGQSLGTQTAAAEALKLIAGDTAARVKIVEAGGVAPLLALLDSTNSKLREHTTAALAHISNSPGQGRLRETGGIPKLCAMLSGDQSHETHRAAADALGWLKSSNAACGADIIAAGAITPLLELFKPAVPVATQGPVRARACFCVRMCACVCVCVRACAFACV